MSEIKDALKHAQEEKTKPYSSAISHAGWKLWCLGYSEIQDEYEFEWLAGNSLTGQVIRFTFRDPDPEASYEYAADVLIDELFKSWSWS
jgi:hypothetical protein